MKILSYSPSWPLHTLSWWSRSCCCRCRSCCCCCCCWSISTHRALISQASKGESVLGDDCSIVGLTNCSSGGASAGVVDTGVGVVVDPVGMARIVVGKDGSVASLNKVTMTIGVDSVAGNLRIVMSSKVVTKFMTFKYSGSLLSWDKSRIQCLPGALRERLQD